jgi:hypothetical protein
MFAFAIGLIGGLFRCISRRYCGLLTTFTYILSLGLRLSFPVYMPRQHEVDSRPSCALQGRHLEGMTGAFPIWHGMQPSSAEQFPGLTLEIFGQRLPGPVELQTDCTYTLRIIMRLYIMIIGLLSPGFYCYLFSTSGYLYIT